MPQKHLDVAFIGGPQYDTLYTRLPQFERESGLYGKRPRAVAASRVERAH